MVQVYLVIRAYFQFTDYVMGKTGWKFYIPRTMKKSSSCRVVSNKNIRVTEILGIAGYFLLCPPSYSTKSERGQVTLARHHNEVIECSAGRQTSQSCGKG
jgi:hypothetical protein